MTTTPLNPTLRFVPIATEIARDARRTLQDRFGHTLAVESVVAPCRVCLRIPEVAQNFILLSYQPSADRNPYAEIGPIYIHANECQPYEATGTFPVDFLGRELVLRAYDWDGRIYDAHVAASGDGPRFAETFLRNPAIAEVHVRHTSYTCFDFKIVRQ
ncbi:MAG: DUF1203 domain-containing protein [Candidatus Eremiobacteraeota bacterium]|nr:DUF1203 domain-containing protein [Candidatus Eremiobacteraeota bacterium]